MRRILFVVLGVVLVGVGVLGIFLPGLPTTIFLLAASFFFARSSPRLHRMLNEHPRLGPYLRQAGRRSMTLKGKLTTLGAMWLGIGLSWFLLGHSGRLARWIVVGLGLVGTWVVAFYLRTVSEEGVLSRRS